MKNSTRMAGKCYVLTILVFLLANLSYSQQVPKSLTASNGQFIGFYQYTPVDYNTNTRYPIIIFLHGIGERGNGTTDLPRVLGNGTPSNIQNGHNMRFTWNGKTETFLVLTPQLDGKYGDWQNFYIDEMIKYAKKNLSIDTNRIFLTGLSLGGGGVWRYVTLPDYMGGGPDKARQLAAIGVCCGTCQGPGTEWCNITNAKLPTWAWHANDDGTVGAGCTAGAISSIQGCNPEVKPYMTLWPTGQHWIWGRVYDTGYMAQHPNIYEWFLGQDKSKPVNKRPVANAGNTINITTGTGVATLNGSASTDADGTIVQYVWSKISGPPFGNITNEVSSGSSTTVTGLNYAGTYVYELRAIDDRADWSTAQVTVVVKDGPAQGNQAPVAKAGNDINITLPLNNATLDGSGSYDNDGTISSYKWTYVSGPTQFNIANANIATTTISNLVAGTYTFKLTVTDNGGLTSEDQVSITVNPAPAPKPPVANAGQDITMGLPLNTTSLDGSASYDPDGSIVSYDWTLESGPLTFNLLNGNSVTASLTALLTGTYTFKLTVTDNSGLKDEDFVTVKVNAAPPPVPPVARAGNDVNITLPANSTSLNGSSSSDADGTINSYQWTKLSGPAQYTIADPNAAVTTLSNLAAGTYVFQLQVTDNDWLTGLDTIQVVVNAQPAGNQPPVANAGANIIITLPVNNTTLDGSASSDPENAISTYSWSRISGPATYSIANTGAASTALTGLVEGVYEFRLVVTDNGGLSDADTVLVVVNAAPPPTNQTAVADAGQNITITLPVNQATLDGTGSYDPDGSLKAYEWKKLSGPAQFLISNANSATTTVRNLVQGTYTFNLRVWDNYWIPSDDVVTVTVLPEPNQAPNANAGNDISITLPVNSTVLNGTGSSDPNTNGSIVSYQWTRISGPTQFTLANANTASTALSNLVQGTYQFKLLVTDNGGLTDTDTVSVTVHAAPNNAPVANAGNNITLTLPANNTTLVGSGSSDPDGNNTIASYQWSKLTGPTQYSIANANTANTGLSNLVQGTYTFRLLVTDNGGLTDDDTVTVTVNAAPNHAPVANAGNNIYLTLPANSTTLNGSGSTDPDGNNTIASYLWSKISGPAQFSISNANAASTALGNLVAGTYTFRLLVTDDGGLTDADTVIVTVNTRPNNPPVAKAGNDITITLPVDSTMLNGSGSTDPDGNSTISSYQWSKVSGPAQFSIANAYASSTALNSLVEGTYTFVLKVTDDGNLSSTDTMVVTVHPAPNKAPVAKAGSDIIVYLNHPEFQLNGTASYDPDGTIESYSWVKISGGGAITIVNSTTSIPTVLGVQEGVYYFDLTVTDDKGATGTDRVKVTVLGAIQGLNADAGRDTSIATPATNSILDGSRSYSPNVIELWLWRQISGPSKALIYNPTYGITGVTDLIPGDYLFELTVYDREGNKDADTVKVSVINVFRYEEKLRLFPNPASTSTVTVRCISDSMGTIRINIYDLNGVFIRTYNGFKSQSHFEMQIPVSNLLKGIYYVEILIADKKKMITKLIKR